MIDVQLDFKGERGLFTVTASGHAGYAPVGADVVCAGVSAILYGFLYYLSGRYGQGLVWSESDGELSMCFPSDCRDACAVLGASLSLMADSYPQYVRLQESR